MDIDDKKRRIGLLVNVLTKAREVYYNPELKNKEDYKQYILSDMEFDKTEEELRKIDSNNKYFKLVGAEKQFKNRIEIIHKYPCLSMQKTTTINGLEDFWNKTRKDLGRQDVELFITPKLDGVSASLSYKNGILKDTATRGDGKIGLYFDPLFVKNIPHDLHDKTFTADIRGEIIIPVSYKETGKIPDDQPLRNMCAGLIHCEERKAEHDFLMFIAYDILPYTKKYTTNKDIISKLKEFKFETVEYYEANTIEEVARYWQVYQDKLRYYYLCETDGLVISVNDLENRKKLEKVDGNVERPYHIFQIALKPQPLSATTSLIDIDWQVSKDGRITPVGVLEPVRIGNVFVNRVMLNNIRFIKANDIKLFDRIEIARSNDVIPKFLHKMHTKRSKEIFLEKCPECGSDVSFDKNNVSYICTNHNCPGQQTAQFEHWFKCVGIENIGEASIEKLIELTGWKSLWQLYSTPLPELKVTLSTACNIHPDTVSMKRLLYTLEESKHLTELDVLGYYGIPGIGKKILEKIHVTSLDDLRLYKDNPSYQVDDSKHIQKLYLWLNNKDNWEDLSNLIFLLRPTMKESNKIMIKKRKFCITGEFSESRTNLIKKITALFDWEFSSVVSKDLYLLICNSHKGAMSTKEKQAKKYNIPIFYSITNVLNLDELKKIEASDALE